MKKIAIIGSNSFMAKNFVKYSKINNLDYKFDLYDISTDSGNNEVADTQKIDFSDLKSIRKIDFSVDAIMIYIGKTGTVSGFDNYSEFINVNETMLLNILHTYVELGAKARIIYPSSRLSFKSQENGRINESGERECRSIYAVTKMAAENYLKIYRETFGVESVILRICTPIGTLIDDCGNYGTFEMFKKQAVDNKEITVFGSGAQRKTFTTMSDICKALSSLINKESLDYSDYNLGGQELCLLEIANYIAEECKVSVKHVEWPEIYEKVDGGSVVFDSARFDKEFDMKYESIV